MAIHRRRQIYSFVFINSFVFISLLFAGSGPFPGVVYGQTFGPDFLDLSTAAGSEKELVEQRIADTVQLEMDDLSRACELTERQVRKLEIAGKRVADNMMERETRTRAEMIGVWTEIGMEGEGNQEAEAQEIDLDQVFSNVQTGGTLYSGANVEDDELWNTTVGNLLTEEQRQKLSRHRRSRLEYLTNAAIQSFIGNADNQLCFSIEQRTRIEEMVKKDFADTIYQNNYGNFDMNPIAAQQFLIEDDDSEEEQSDEDEELEFQERLEKFRVEVKELLSESQHKIWKSDYEPQISGEWVMNGVGGGGGIF